MNHVYEEDFCFEDDCKHSDRLFQQQQFVNMIDAFNSNDLHGFEDSLEEVLHDFGIRLPAKAPRVMFMDYITYEVRGVPGVEFTDDEWDFIHDNLSFIIKCAYELESSRGIKRAIEEIAVFFGIKITEQGE